jgi:hypothetical protein
MKAFFFVKTLKSTREYTSRIKTENHEGRGEYSTDE